jgi:hypothetical protein
MHFISPGGTPRYPTREEVRHDSGAGRRHPAWREGRRPGLWELLRGRRASCALGAAYEGCTCCRAKLESPAITSSCLRLPRIHAPQLPGRLQEAVTLASMILHMNPTTTGPASASRSG